MANRWAEAFSGLGRELLEGIRDRFQENLDDAAFEERVIGIENATAAMLVSESKWEYESFSVNSYQAVGLL